MKFRYIQLRHALGTQFAEGLPSPQVLPMVDVIIGNDPLKLISSLYSIIRTRTVARVIDTARIRWEMDIGPVDDSDWDEILENVKQTSPRLSDHLTQLYIIHRAYLTPSRLSKFRPDQSPDCPRCSDNPCTFFHLIWSCPHTQSYWAQIIKFLHDQMGSPVQMDPKLCLFGLLPDTAIEKYQATFLQETFLCQKSGG